MNSECKYFFGKIKLYFARVKESVKFAFNQEFRDYIEIIDYKLNFKSICKFSLNLKKKYENVESLGTIEYLYQNCMNFYNRYFNGSNYFIFNTHEKICTNDCLIDFKYKYEFTTNYDIDEVIFPRKYKTNDFSHFKNIKKCSQSLAELNHNYSIYEYAVKLTKDHGSNIGIFQFENVAFLTVPVVNFFEKSIFSLPLNISFQKTIILEDIGNRIFLNISSRDIELIKDLTDLKTLVQCFNRTIFNGKKLNLIWNVPYALSMKIRTGKSLYNTNLTVIYNQHSSHLLVPGAKKFVVSIHDGYVGHFRQYLEVFFKNQVQPFSDFIYDIEFYQFLAKNFA